RVGARAGGDRGASRNFRRAVAEVEATWNKQRRTYRPWVPVPGEHLVFDWATEAGWHVFCAVLAWSRYRFIRFATDETRPTTLGLLAECLEELGGVPNVLLTDRMGCLRASTVANVWCRTRSMCSSALGTGAVQISVKRRSPC